MDLPAGARFVLERLTGAGFAAYVVGGCVRDAMRGDAPKDYDVCTSARPEETKRVFSDCRTVDTGLAHGTVTVIARGEPYEVTTFRVDGAYADHRHPDRVDFVRQVERDLARRDFTVNAMAYNPWQGLCDPFGGPARGLHPLRGRAGAPLFRGRAAHPARAALCRDERLCHRGGDGTGRPRARAGPGPRRARARDGGAL